MFTGSRHARRRGPLAGIGAITAAALLLMTGCSTDQASGGSTQGANNASAEVQARLTAAAAVPELVSPGPKIDLSSVKGKSIFVIPLFSNNEYNQYIDQAMVEVGAMTGTTVDVFDNQGQVNQWASGINQAIAQKADVLVLSGGIDPRLLLPQIAAARQAGIKVISSQFYDNSIAVDASCGTETTIDCPAGLDAVLPAPYRDSARLNVDWIINHSGGKAKTLVLTANDVGPNAYQVDEIEKEFAAQCPDCQQTYVNIPSSQWATNTQSTVQSALNQDPELTYVLPVYDVMATDAATAIGVAGRTGKVKIATFNGTPAVLDQIASGDTVAMDVGQNLAQIGYANMDQAFRLLSGMSPSTTARDVIRSFTKENVGEAGDPPAPNGGFGDGYLADYKQIWGLQ